MTSAKTIARTIRIAAAMAMVRTSQATANANRVTSARAKGTASGDLALEGAHRDVLRLARQGSTCAASSGYCIVEGSFVLGESSAGGGGPGVLAIETACHLRLSPVSRAHLLSRASQARIWKVTGPEAWPGRSALNPPRPPVGSGFMSTDSSRPSGPR